MQKLEDVVREFKTVIGVIFTVVTIGLATIGYLQNQAEQSLTKIVNDYCKKPVELRHFVRAEANRIIHPNKIEITCGESDE